MARPRIIIADTDISYLTALQLKFAEEFFEEVDLELIGDEDYYNFLFSAPQKADILIVSSELYDPVLERHSIGHIFLMTEQKDAAAGGAGTVCIFKYTSTKEVFNEVIKKSTDVLRLPVAAEKECSIILVYSASGGTGKTTLALGISACLEAQFKRVLYINAAELQTFQGKMKNKAPAASSEVYAKLPSAGENSYRIAAPAIRKEGFSYLPSFKAALMSLGLEYCVFKNIAEGAKRSGDYDHIVIDADSVFDENRAALINISDKVLVVTDQSRSSVYAANLLVSNISDPGSGKYIFICNNFRQHEENALILPEANVNFFVSDYVENFAHYEQMSPEDLAKEESVQRAALLVM